MKAGFTTLAKLLVICLSLSLLGGYVYWRAEKAKEDQARLDALNEARERAMKTLREDLANDQAEQDGGDFTITGSDIMSSTKSGRVVMPSTKKALVMPSSKSGVAFNLSDEELQQLLDDAKKAEQEGAIENPSKERVIMPSSKSIDSILIPREQRPQQQQQK